MVPNTNRQELWPSSGSPGTPISQQGHRWSTRALSFPTKKRTMFCRVETSLGQVMVDFSSGNVYEG